MVQENERARETTHRRVLRKDQEAVHQGEVGWSQQRRLTTHECEVEANDETNQHRQGTRIVRSNSITRGVADAVVSNCHQKQVQGVLMFNDTSPAYMYARTSSDRHIELCEEDKIESGDENRCEKLMKSMYGTRAAAHDWQSEVTKTMIDLGFKQRKASPRVFWHGQRDIETFVHGDDFMSPGERTELEWMCKGSKKFETKMIMVTMIWPRRQEADLRHAEIISRDAGAEKLEAISKPAAKETGRETEEETRFERAQIEWQVGRQD